MVGHQADDGGDPLRAVNIETLISAVRLLQDRESHEAAPFVAAWKPGADGFSGARLDQSLGRTLGAAINKAVMKSGADADLLNSVAEIARAATQRRSGEIFQRVERELLLSLKRELSVLKSVEYLRAIAEKAVDQPNGLDVISLNYDLAVETMSLSVAGIEIDTGIQRWKPGVPLEFGSRDRKLNLFKLHGSLDWTVVEDRSRNPHLSSLRIKSDVVDERAAPWIVVGDREKLATDGPTLALLRSAEAALERASHLVIVGYSFGDRHINAMVRDWMLGDDTRSITALDVAWPDPWEATDPRAAYLRSYGRASGPGVAPRFVAITGKASRMLGIALFMEPQPEPNPYISVAIGGRSPHITLTLTNNGPTLRSFNLRGSSEAGEWAMQPHVKSKASDRNALQLDPNAHASGSRQSATYEIFRSGTSIKAYPTFPATTTRYYLSASAQDAAGNREFLLEAGLP
jgi:hypothetical protein